MEIVELLIAIVIVVSGCVFIEMWLNSITDNKKTNGRKK